MQADLAVETGFRYQFGVADDHPAHGGGAEVGGGRAQFRCLVAGGHPTLEGEVVVHVPYGIDLGAELTAEHLVVVITATQGQDQVVGQAPVVLQEDGVLVAVHFHHHIGIGHRLAQTVAAMFQVFILVGQTTGQGMRTEEPAGLGVGGDDLELDTFAGLGVEGAAVFRVIVVDIGVGEDAPKFAIVGDEVVLLHRVGIGGLSVLGQAAARLLPALLLGIAMTHGKRVLVIEIPGQLAAGILPPVLRVGRGAIALPHEVAFVLLVVGAGELQAEHVLDQRHVHYRTGLVAALVDLVTAARR